MAAPVARTVTGAGCRQVPLYPHVNAQGTYAGIALLGLFAVTGAPKGIAALPVAAGVEDDINPLSAPVALTSAFITRGTISAFFRDGEWSSNLFQGSHRFCDAALDGARSTESPQSGVFVGRGDIHKVYL